MRITIVSPHRDDAAFSLGLSIEAWLRSGHRVQIMNCFTRSEYAPYSDVHSLHPNDRASFVSGLRRREDTAWNKLLGGGLQFNDLDLLDAPLRLACDLEELGSVAIRPGDRAVARVGGALAKLARGAGPDRPAILVPLAAGGHIDHRVVMAAAVEALRDTALSLGFYEDMPYTARPGGEMQAHTAAEEVAMRLGAQLTAAHSAPTEGEQAARRKRRMIDCYDSQIDSEVAGQVVAFGERHGERIWVNPAGSASALVAAAPFSDAATADSLRE